MTSRSLVRSLAVATALVVACSGSSGSVGPPAGGAPSTGQTCSQASQCYGGLPDASVHGQVTCLTQLAGGYCTHECQADADCCATPGECPDGRAEVCASFESSGKMYCFLSCEAAAIAAAPDGGSADPTTYCQQWASASFTCRSTGGGNNNRKFCGP